MRLALLALASTLPAASSALPAAPASAAPKGPPTAEIPALLCSDGLKARPVGSPRAAKPRRLGELPPGDLTLTVLNRAGDCIEPVTVRQGFGGPGRR
jgi:hypothetical protein